MVDIACCAGSSGWAPGGDRPCASAAGAFPDGAGGAPRRRPDTQSMREPGRHRPAARPSRHTVRSRHAGDCAACL